MFHAQVSEYTTSISLNSSLNLHITPNLQLTMCPMWYYLQTTTLHYSIMQLVTPVLVSVCIVTNGL